MRFLKTKQEKLSETEEIYIFKSEEMMEKFFIYVLNEKYLRKLNETNEAEIIIN